MLQVSEAREKLLQHFSPGEVEIVPFTEAAGRVLAESIIAELDSPSFSHSAMDGVAIFAGDLDGPSEKEPTVLSVIGEVAAGDGGALEIQPGQAALIMTGAPLPVGADTVIRVEDTDLDFSSGRLPERVTIYVPAEKGSNIRRRAENYRAGTEILEIGRSLLAQDIGMLAGLGKAQIAVFKRPKVGIFASGDEVVEPGTRLKPGQIWNSNSHMLAALVESCGGEVERLGIIPDRIPEILSALNELISIGADLILTSGGVSMGVHDYIRKVMEEQGQLNFWKINMRPGKPLAFGHFGGVPFIGLPGNPVSSFVGALMFVRPALFKMSGSNLQVEPSFSQAILGDDLMSDGRESYLPGLVKFKAGQERVRAVGNQSSGNLFALVQANCLIKIAPGVQSLRQESIVEIWKFNRGGSTL
jgi:molybdopterin molybdotransferase